MKDSKTLFVLVLAQKLQDEYGFKNLRVIFFIGTFSKAINANDNIPIIKVILIQFLHILYTLHKTRAVTLSMGVHLKKEYLCCECPCFLSVLFYPFTYLWMSWSSARSISLLYSFTGIIVFQRTAFSCSFARVHIVNSFYYLATLFFCESPFPNFWLILFFTSLSVLFSSCFFISSFILLLVSLFCHCLLQLILMFLCVCRLLLNCLLYFARSCVSFVSRPPTHPVPPCSKCLWLHPIKCIPSPSPEDTIFITSRPLAWQEFWAPGNMEGHQRLETIRDDMCLNVNAYPCIYKWYVN